MLLAPLVVFAVLAAAYAVTSPPFENPDEVAHAQYATFLSDYGRLPRLLTDCVRMAFHPPLYHALISPLARVAGVTTETVFAGYQINRDPTSPHLILTHGFPDEVFPYAGGVRFVQLGRLVSILASLVTLLYTWKLAGLLLASRALALIATMTVASLPQFQYVAASLNHDGLTASATSAFLFHATRLARSFPSDAALKAGFALGIALLTKSSALAMAPLVPLAALLSARSVALAAILRRATALFAVAFAIAGFWYLRNVDAFGTPVPTVHLVHTTWVGFQLARSSAPSGNEILAIAYDLFRSFVFLGGLMDLAAPTWLYLSWGLLLSLALIGLGPLCARRIGLVPVAALVSSLASVAHFNLSVSSPQGRYLFIALPVIGVAVAAGFARVVPPSARRSLIPVAVVAPPLLAVAFFALGFRPTYAGIRERPREATWGGTAQLHCANEYRAEVRSPGGPIEAIELLGSRRGAGGYDVELALFRSGEPAPLARASVSSSEVPLERGPVRFAFSPVATEPGERLSLRLRAPGATPIARSIFFYRHAPPGSGNLTVNGLPLDAVLSVDAE